MRLDVVDFSPFGKVAEYERALAFGRHCSEGADHAGVYELDSRSADDSELPETTRHCDVADINAVRP